VGRRQPVAQCESGQSPLGLATLAALCPPDWEVEIVDENVKSVPIEPKADIVGICGMDVQFARQSELLSYYRRSIRKLDRVVAPRLAECVPIEESISLIIGTNATSSLAMVSVNTNQRHLG
jgi:hypothetical protein